MHAQTSLSLPLELLLLLLLARRLLLLFLSLACLFFLLFLCFLDFLLFLDLCLRSRSISPSPSPSSLTWRRRLLLTESGHARIEPSSICGISTRVKHDSHRSTLRACYRQSDQTRLVACPQRWRLYWSSVWPSFETRHRCHCLRLRLALDLRPACAYPRGQRTQKTWRCGQFTRGRGSHGLTLPFSSAEEMS